MTSLKLEHQDLLDPEPDILHTVDSGLQRMRSQSVTRRNPQQARVASSTKAEGQSSIEAGPAHLPSPQDSNAMNSDSEDVARKQTDRGQPITTNDASHYSHSAAMYDHHNASQQQPPSNTQLPTPTNGDMMGVLDDEMLALGAHSRQLIKAIQKLEVLQIKSTLPSLPKFVVVGDQSAGKSSIIEALCDISLPRNEGTCTRCPFQITTTSNSQQNGHQWLCSIKIQANYDYNPRRANSTVFEHWHDRIPTTIPFATITNKSELAPLLIRAQQAVLNPTTSPDNYLSGTPPPGRQTEFSPNLVCLDITGPELPDMSFFDLPGTINVVGDPHQQHLVGLVEKMIEAYISDPKALVLLACSADQDIETSTTFRFVRQCRAEPRCLGVLTKADLVAPHRIERIHHILNNTSFGLNLGWYITKQLSSAQLSEGITHTQARALEKTFFATHPWSGLEAARNGRYGITNLQDAISLRLTQHIRDDMPEIIGRVRDRIRNVDAELALFGERDANPILTVRDVVRDIADSVMHHITGRVNRKDFFAVLANERLKLRQSLAEYMPGLDFSTPGYKAPELAVNLCDDDSDDDTASPSTPMQSNSQRSLTSMTPTPRAPKRKAPETLPQRSAKKARCEADGGLTKLVFKLNEIEEIIRANSDNSLMTQTSTEVNNILILRFMDNWSKIIDSVLERVRNHVLGMMEAVGRQQLSKYHATMLFPEALRALKDFGCTIIDREFASIYKLLAREQHRPITSVQLRDTVEGLKRNLAAKRRERRLKEHFDNLEATTGKAINDAERKKKAADDTFLRGVPSDAYAASVEAFALPQAYYQIAAPRFNDNVFQHVDYDLLHTIHNEVGDVLMAKLNATNAEACAQLLMEDPERERLRQQLQAEKERLGLAMTELNELRNASSS